MKAAALSFVCIAIAPAQVNGIVVDPAGAPIAAARVHTIGNAAPVVTSVDGRFSLPLGPGSHRLTVAADGFSEVVRQVDLRSGPLEIEVVLALAEKRDTVTVSESAGYQTLLGATLKSPTPLLDVPQTLTVVGRSQMQDQSMQSMADVVRYVPGITMAQGEGHRDAPVIRGNATTSDFYVNGVRDDVQYFRDLYNLERVEAVKGANALTFGRGGGGGVINRVTKQAAPDPVHEVSIQGGTFGNKRATADFGGRLAEKAALRFNTMYENSNSFRHNVNVERYGLTPTVSVRAGERTLIRASYEFFHDGRVVDRGVPSFAGRPSPAHVSTFFGDPSQSFATAGVHLGSAVVEHQRGSWTLRNSTLVGDYDKFYQNIFPGAVNGSLTLVSLSGYNNHTARRNLFNQTDATGTMVTGPVRHTLLAGAEFGRQRTANFRQTAYFNGTSATAIDVPFRSPNVAVAALFRQAAADANNGAANRVASGFVQDQLELTRHVQLIAGLRYDNFNINYLDNKTSQRLGRADHLVAPRLGVVVKPAANVSLYGSFGVTYLPSSGDQFASLTATTRTLRPERFNNYETGIKMDLRRGLSLTAALYRLDRNNSTARDPNDPARIVQTGSQRTKGAELGIGGSLTRRWQVAGGFAAQDAFVSSATTIAVKGAKVALVPGHTVSLWNNYRLLPRWNVGLGVVRQAAMWTGIDNTVRLPGFTRADAAIFVTLTDTLRLQANCENLFGTLYYPTAHSNNNILPGSPRSSRVGLIARF